jgi:hypothetical protein
MNRKPDWKYHVSRHEEFSGTPVSRFSEQEGVSFYLPETIMYRRTTLPPSLPD